LLHPTTTGYVATPARVPFLARTQYQRATAFLPATIAHPKLTA